MPATRLEALRAARLHRQSRAPDVDTLVRASIGLHSTDYATPYLSSRARVPGFAGTELYARLNAGRGLYRVNAMRNTVHVVHAEDLPTVLAATGAGVRAVGRKGGGIKALSDTEVTRTVDALVALLSEGPRSTNQLKAALPALAADLRYWLLLAMGEGRVLRADGPNPRSNRTRYVATAAWVSPPALPVPSEARATLIRRAVEAFGPVTEADLAWWLPAPKGEVARALKGLDSLLVDGVRYWFPASLAASLATTEPRDALGAWALPYEDALLKGYFDRDWLFAPGVRPRVFPHNNRHWWPPDGGDPGPGPHGGVNTSGEARPTLWWQGRVVGRWEQDGESIAHQLHADVGAEGRIAIEEELGRVEAFLRGGLGAGEEGDG